MRLIYFLLVISFFFLMIALSFLCSSCEKKEFSKADASGNSQQVKIVNQKEDGSSQTDRNDPNLIHPRSKERISDRRGMVEVLKERYGMTDEKVLRAMLDVPRHWFIPPAQQSAAYHDGPLPIGFGQTISQPFIVAYMTSLLELTPKSKVLEIGTGSGYQAAVLSELTPHVFTIEIVKPLGQKAMDVFKKCGYDQIKTMIGDGYKGWPEYAPFDAIIVTCAPDHIPQPLIDQLKPDGKIVIPVGKSWNVQYLLLVTKNKDGTLNRKSMMPVRFVPLIRETD